MGKGGVESYKTAALGVAAHHEFEVVKRELTAGRKAVENTREATQLPGAGTAVRSEQEVRNRDEPTSLRFTERVAATEGRKKVAVKTPERRKRWNVRKGVQIKTPDFPGVLSCGGRI